jgi:hypothetical protein
MCFKRAIWLRCGYYIQYHCYYAIAVSFAWTGTLNYRMNCIWLADLILYGECLFYREISIFLICTDDEYLEIVLWKKENEQQDLFDDIY